MSAALTLTLLSPIRVLVKSVSIQWVALQTPSGRVEIFPGHAPLRGVLEAGVFEYQGISQSSKVQGFISRGAFEVLSDHIDILAETLELKEEVDFLRAQAAQQKAEKILQESHLEVSHLKKYQLKLQRSLIRQNLFGSEG